MDSDSSPQEMDSGPDLDLGEPWVVPGKSTGQWLPQLESQLQPGVGTAQYTRPWMLDSHQSLPGSCISQQVLQYTALDYHVMALDALNYIPPSTAMSAFEAHSAILNSLSTVELQALGTRLAQLDLLSNQASVQSGLVDSIDDSLNHD